MFLCKSRIILGRFILCVSVVKAPEMDAASRLPDSHSLSSHRVSKQRLILSPNSLIEAFTGSRADNLTPTILSVILKLYLITKFCSSRRVARKLRSSLENNVPCRTSQHFQLFSGHVGLRAPLPPRGDWVVEKAESRAMDEEGGQRLS